jgi:hypothetical protein
MTIPPPPAPEPRIAFEKFAGMVNTVSEERLDPNELVAAINVDLDDRGQFHRRRGYTKMLAGDCHSLFQAVDDTVYGVVNQNLCIVNPNYSLTVLKTGLASDPSAGFDPLSWAQVGDTIYFSSPQDSGKIVERTVLPWGMEVSPGRWLSPVIHPTPTLASIQPMKAAIVSLLIPSYASSCVLPGRSTYS